MQGTFKPVGEVKLPRIFNQLGILVLDGSGSMTEMATGNATKAKHVESACFELFNRINASRVKQNFSFACIKFDNTPTVTLPPTQFDFNLLMNTNFDPLEGKGGKTYINLALQEAKKMAEEFLANAPADGVPHKVIILLLSDGMCFEPEKTLEIARQIKANPLIEIATVYFGTIGNNDVEAQNLMREIASDPTRYTTVYDGEALRSFFERSISQSAGIKFGDVQ